MAGSNIEGQLGVNLKDDALSTSLTAIDLSEKVVQAKCGDGYTIVLLESG
jgi:hypothetical protein